MTEKQNNNGKRFILGALIGGAVGAIAGRFFKANEEEIKEGVDKKVDQLKNKVDEVKSKIDNCKNDVEEKVVEKESSAKK